MNRASDESQGEPGCIMNRRNIQEEEIHRVQTEMAAAAKRYSDLDDFAPVGHFDLDADSSIRLVNLSGANLVGLERARWVGRRFGSLVAAGRPRAFAAFLARVFANQEKHVQEFALSTRRRCAMFFSRLPSFERSVDLFRDPAPRRAQTPGKVNGARPALIFRPSDDDRDERNRFFAG